MTELTYILGTELFGSLSITDKTRLESLIKKSANKPFLYFLIKSNILLGLFSPSRAIEEFWKVQNILASHTLPQSILKKLINSKYQGRPLFHRQQLLFVIKKFIRHNPENFFENIELTDEDMNFLGRLCINANNLLSEQNERGFDSLLLQFLAVFELFNPPEPVFGIARTLEYLRLVNDKYPDFDKGLTLDEFFEKRSGIGIKFFLQLITSIYANYLNNSNSVDEFLKDDKNFNLRKSTYFSNLQIDGKEIETFFDMVCRSAPELQELLKEKNLEIGKEYYDFTVFRKYPLLFLKEDDIFTCIDIGFLLEKVTNGLYRTIHNSLPDHPAEKNKKEPLIANKFQSSWASIVEDYVGNILDGQPGLSKNVEFNINKSQNKQIDFILNEDESIAIIEVKGGGLSNKKFSESNELIEEINKKFGVLENKSGVLQLIRDIEILYNKNEGERSKLRNFKDSKFLDSKTIYPILLVDESSFGWNMLQFKLQSWFKEKRNERNKISKDVNVSELLVLHIETLEIMEPYLKAGEFKFLDFIKFYDTRIKSGLGFRETESLRTLEMFLKVNNFTNRNNDRIFNDFSIFLADLMSKMAE